MRLALSRLFAGRDVSQLRWKAFSLPTLRLLHFPRVAVVAGVVLTSSVVVSCAHAQATTGDVVGTVVDSTGSAIPGATVELTNLDTHEKRTVVTGDSGQYTFTLLKPNRYSLAISRSGFKKSTINTFSLAAGDRAREDSTLQVGAEDQTVQVEAQAPVLQSDSSVLAATITNEATQDLPLNGRNYINLVQVVPGATEGLNNGLASGNRPDDRRQTSSVSINGQADVINNQLIDGMDNNERVIGSIGVRPSVESIQEVNVQTNTFTAEVGRSAGAIINVITKSGTNGFHGSAYEFFRNTVLDANPYKFGAVIPKPSGTRISSAVASAARFRGTRPSSSVTTRAFAWSRDKIRPRLRCPLLSNDHTRETSPTTRRSIVWWTLPHSTELVCSTSTCSRSRPARPSATTTRLPHPMLKTPPQQTAAWTTTSTTETLLRSLYL